VKRPLWLKTSVIVWSLALATVAVGTTVAITALGTKSAKTFNEVPKAPLPASVPQQAPPAAKANGGGR
jgi:hypothetical protein